MTAVTDVDPWLSLDESNSPGAADRRAQALLGHAPADDPRRVAGLVSWLVQRAALDGSTVLAVDVLVAALRAYEVADPAAGVELALHQGRVVAFPEDRVLGHPVAALAEDRVADALVELVAAGSVASGADLSAADLVAVAVATPLTVACIPRGDTRRGLRKSVQAAATEQGARTVCMNAGEIATHGDGLRDADVIVVDGAERLSLPDGADLLERLAGGGVARLVLLGDPDELDGRARATSSQTWPSPRSCRSARSATFGRPLRSGC